VGIAFGAFIFHRKRKRAEAARRNMRMSRPDPFTMGFGSDDPKPALYNNNDFPPQSAYNDHQPQQQFATFNNYEVAPVSHTTMEGLQQPTKIYPHQPIVSPTPTVVSEVPMAGGAEAMKAMMPEQTTTPSLGIFIVIATYIPTLSDELEIEPGDQIELIVEYDDGWCQGVNISKGYTRGVFPRHCIDYATAPSNHTPAATIDSGRSKRVSSMYRPN
jgi:hypothetical protein